MRPVTATAPGITTTKALRTIVRRCRSDPSNGIDRATADGNPRAPRAERRPETVRPMEKSVHCWVDRRWTRMTRDTKLSATNPRVPSIITRVPRVTELRPSCAPEEIPATFVPMSSGRSEGKSMPRPGNHAL